MRPLATGVCRIVPQPIILARPKLFLIGSLTTHQPLATFVRKVTITHRRRQRLPRPQRRQPRPCHIRRRAPPWPNIIKLIGGPKLPRLHVGLVIDQPIIVVVKRVLIANGGFGRGIKLPQLRMVIGTRKQTIDLLGVLPRIQGVLAMVAGVAHRRPATIRKGDFAVGNLEVPKSCQHSCFEFGIKKQNGEVAMHATNHRFGDGTAQMTLVVGEPALHTPPFVFTGFGDPDGVFGQTIQALHQPVT